MDIKSLYIINRESGVCLYHKDFVDSQFDPHLISSFIAALTSFFREPAHGPTSFARAFEGSDYKILVEFGEWTIGALSASSEDEGLRESLRRMIHKFEEEFSVLRYVELDLAVYSRFEKNVLNEFVRQQVDPDAIIRPRLNWDLYVRNAEVRALLSLLPAGCTVREAAEFLEMPLDVTQNLVAEALWERAVTLSRPVRPDDIYQTTSLSHISRKTPDISEEIAKAMTELDGETPLSIAAERVKTSDIRKFLNEIARLADRKAVERVSPSQFRLVLYTAVIREILDSFAYVMGFKLTRNLFLDSKDSLLNTHSWLAFLDLEDGVDIDIRSSLVIACVRGRFSPEMLTDGFHALLQFLTRRAAKYIGSKIVNAVLYRVEERLEQQFPNTAREVGWASFRL